MGSPTKYPRTSHLPSSPGKTKDDRVISKEALAVLRRHNNFVVTEKMDGGNLTMMRDHFYARSLDSGTQPWDTPAKALWATIHHQIPDGWRVSGESLYARRSVGYDNLPGHYLIFGLWDENGNLLDWELTQDFAQELGVPTVPVLYRGDSFDEAEKAWFQQREEKTSEGFVIRDAGMFPASTFRDRAAKWVREGHVQTSDSWRHRDDFAINGVVTQ